MIPAAARSVILGVVACCATWVAIDPPAGGKDFAAWVERRVQEWQPTAAERSFDRIGWVESIREAERLAKEHNRPVFLFTFDGPSMSLGRC